LLTLKNMRPVTVVSAVQFGFGALALMADLICASAALVLAASRVLIESAVAAAVDA
jgi:hypothetical protein